MTKEFWQAEWDESTIDDCRHLARLAIREDLGRGMDLSTVSLIPAGAHGSAKVVSRKSGTVAGIRSVEVVLQELESGLCWSPELQEGQGINPGSLLGDISGPARDLLTAERIILNFLGHLSGVATHTAQFVKAVSGTRAKIFDTRKTIPAWRRLEKFAVRCGGGRNHRTGLYEAIMIKDNHLAFGSHADPEKKYSPSEAIRRARAFLEETFGPDEASRRIVEVEVDCLQQLEAVLPDGPDIVLLDNMNPDQLRKAVKIRDESAPSVQLEASGGVNLKTVRAIAESGVDRISVGALTHSAPNLDVGLDWDD